jgi:DNA-binding NtrC family response regulator
MGAIRLLLVDDDAAVAELLKKYLERLGYEVDACTAPEDALTRFDAEPQRYSLVLTDLTLPGMNGEQLLDRMRQSNPKLRAIISSGYPYQPRARRVTFLQKPFLPKMLAEAVEQALNSPDVRPGL